eukprot:3287647-Alexandrium_andersonii.AAC.1
MQVSSNAWHVASESCAGESRMMRTCSCRARPAASIASESRMRALCVSHNASANGRRHAVSAAFVLMVDAARFPIMPAVRSPMR